MTKEDAKTERKNTALWKQSGEEIRQRVNCFDHSDLLTLFVIRI
jgi:hypothetical protein